MGQLEHTILTCRFCGHILDEIVQQPMRPGKQPITLVTCENKTCVIFGHTISLDRHMNGDLSIYLKGKDTK